MSTRPISVWFFSILLGFAGPLLGQDSRGGTNSGPSSSAQKTTGRPTPRGPLPDPVLFDGSKHQAEKKSEYGMLGDFEIPGDENAQSDKVGGQQQGGGQGDLKTAQGGQGAQPQGAIPQGAGGGQGAPGQPPSKDDGPGGPGGGQNDPNAKAEGIQVAELKTDESAGPAGAGGGSDPNAQKPKPVAIGDPTRQIKPAANAPGVVGAQTTAGQTQQMEKAVGGSGKASPGNNSNKGVEKGRAMPTGL